ncbi:MAG: hypothetical protein LBN31_02935 [Hungatella sp.]|nr:hypothetical protein [Hungatella sp.]
MNVEDLLEQMVCERIEMLLRVRSKEAICEEKEFKRRMEELSGQLEKERKMEMEQFWDDWIARCADENRYLYFAGVKDGFWIYRMLLENESSAEQKNRLEYGIKNQFHKFSKVS